MFVCGGGGVCVAVNTAHPIEINYFGMHTVVIYVMYTTNLIIILYYIILYYIILYYIILYYIILYYNDLISCI